MGKDQFTLKQLELMNERIKKKVCPYCGCAETYYSYEGVPPIDGVEKRCKQCHRSANNIY